MDKEIGFLLIWKDKTRPYVQLIKFNLVNKILIDKYDLEFEKYRDFVKLAEPN